MFVRHLLKTNPQLVELALTWEREGIILPDTYLIDLDAVCSNACLMLDSAKRSKITLYFMLKQLGRNPLVARKLFELGFPGAVCVDFHDAQVMIEAGVHIGNVGHLVQVPRNAIARVVAARPDVITIYSVAKAHEIGDEALRQGFVQPIMLRVIGPNDVLYSGQYGGFVLDELENTVHELEGIPGVRIAGVCSFPCVLYFEDAKDFVATHNASTVIRAADLLESMGYKDLQLNMPSASCTRTIPLVASLGGTHMEPGHGLTGTTPYHAVHDDAEESVAYVYVSEVSHCYGGKAFCYAGGHYRRGHMSNAIVGWNLKDAHLMQVTPPTAESIDYYFELAERCDVGTPVVMCYRTQMFTTRSEVAVVSGLSAGKPQLEGIFDAQGRPIR